MGRRVQALDGFRGLAISLVLLQHLFGVPTGGFGVDVFFVLSGYLITSILRAERGEVKYWRIFYVRRVTRIVPAYLILIVAACTLFDLPWRNLWPYYAFFGANIAPIKYYKVLGPLIVLWSLAIEEHFYFVWPWLIRFLSDLVLGTVLVSVAVLEPIVRVLTMRAFSWDWQTFYWLTPFHLDGLAMGSLMSIVLSMPGARAGLQKVLRPALLVLFVTSVLVFGVLHKTPAKSPLLYAAFGYPLIASTSALILAWLVLHQHGAVARSFRWKPLRFLGVISYSLYLYHDVVVYLVWRMAGRHGYMYHRPLSPIALPIAIGIAWLSYRFIEKPTLDFGRRKAGAYKKLNAPALTTP